MLFHSSNTRKPRKARPALDHLTDRLAPAVYTWVGVVGGGFADYTNEAYWAKSGDSTPGDDGYPGGPGHTSDTPKFDTLDPSWRPPKIHGGTDITVNNFEVTSNWTRDIVVDGTLTIKMSSSYGSGALTGDGLVTFDSGTSPSGTHGIWESHGVKTKTVVVKGQLNFHGSGQIGYDVGGGGSWTVASNGVMYATGTHSLGSDIDVQGHFTAGDLTLTHAGAGSPSTYDLKSFTLYTGASLLIETDKTFSLNGTKFTQGAGSTTTLEAGAHLTVGDNTPYADGGTAYDKNISVSSGTVKMYPNSAIGTTNGDIRFSSYSKLDIYSPASWEQSGVANIGYVDVSAGGTNRSLNFVDSAQINFKDYTPTGATNVIQGGVTFYSYGSVFFADTTAISARWWDNFYVGRNCSINTSCSLTISGTPPPPPTQPWVVIYCNAGSLTGRFGSISPPPAGWRWIAGYPLYESNLLAIAWEQVP